MRRRLASLTLIAACGIAGCGPIWNDPYPASERGQNILYTAFVQRPKHLDPAQSYSEDEAEINTQIYEPPLQYHYLKRPYTLIPLAAREIPKPKFLDANGREVRGDSPLVAESVYEIRIRPGIYYQPHPAFARDEAGRLLYDHLSAADLEGVHSLEDFPRTGTRELTAEDYVYEIKRLADPRLAVPIYGLMSEYIVGLRELSETLKRAEARQRGAWIDLRNYPLAGAQVEDRYTYRVRIRGRYPQFLYWLAMPFFAPVPWEADRFYSQPGMLERDLSLDRWPVGTGPYAMVRNNPNSRIVLARNPNFHGETYPAEGAPGDAEAGLLADAGKPIPFIERIVFSREKEGIPYWNKFLQGYYDFSGISSDVFDQAVRISIDGNAVLSPEMQAKGIRLTTDVATATSYMAFNWLDPVVGGSSERSRKLRQAISIAVDMEEYIAIFANGRGIPAQGPIPPGIFGYREGREGMNPVVYDWVNGAPRRKPIEAAKRLLAEAGYPDGRDAKTGQPLVLHLDVTGRGPEDKSRFDWYRKQFAKLNIQLEIRDTDYNRFQDKVRKGAEQIFIWGWLADYPDPENFLFLLSSAQGKVAHGGENAANYSNPEYDALFEKMKNMENGPERQALIDRMLAIAREDAPWIWGFHPMEYRLSHAWLANVKPNQMVRHGYKYERLDPKLRETLRERWNRPVLWPLALLALLAAAAIAPAVIAFRRRERAAAKTA